MTRHEKIVQLNDELRKTFRGGRVQMTPAVYSLDPQLRGRVLWAMARYNRFADDSEHDWGVMIFAGYSFEWHIEYRAANGAGKSPDPADPDKTFRVLTLYIAEDLLAKTNPQAESTPAKEPQSEDAIRATGTRLR